LSIDSFRKLWRGLLERSRRKQHIPADVAHVIATAETLAQQLEWSAAEATVNAALERYPNNSRLLSCLGRLAAKQDQGDRALELFGMAISAQPGDAELHFERGNVFSDSGRHTEAVADYQRALALKPDYPEAHYRLGLAWRDQDRFTEAAASYHRALELRPGYVEVWNNLGAVQQLTGQFDEALASYRRALDLGPRMSQPYLNLGRLLERLGDRPGAARTYALAVDRGIDPDTFRHLLHAAQGFTTARAPANYARNVFDHFAEHFDRQLVDELGYRIPQILAARVKARSPRSDLRVLDLGCGTGLCGVHIHDHAGVLTGVDLSEGMLTKARARDIYDELIQCDLAEYLATAPAGTFDAALAADVFIYLGDLAQIFRDVARVLIGGGIFAFSIEEARDADGEFVLQPSGRYAQSVSYIRRLAAQAGLQEAEAFPEVIRGQAGHETNGYVFVLCKP